METNKTLAEDFGGERVVSNGYGGFMEGLLQLVEGKEIGAPLGEQIKAYALGFVEEHDLGGFNRFSDETYVRDYIGRDAGTGWEAIVMCWKRATGQPFTATRSLPDTRLPTASFWWKYSNPAEQAPTPYNNSISPDNWGSTPSAKPGNLPTTSTVLPA